MATDTPRTAITHRSDGQKRGRGQEKLPITQDVVQTGPSLMPRSLALRIAALTRRGARRTR